MKEYWELFINGIKQQNPVFRLALSLCPAVAVTSSVVNGFWLGIAVVFVITASNTIVSIFRHVINEKVRVPIYIAIIASLVTFCDLMLNAFAPDVHKELGIYIKLIVVFAIILARAEMFASKNPVDKSFVDGFGMGVGFLVALVIISFVRELIGTGKIAGISIFGPSYEPVLFMILPPGGFVTIGLLIGLFNVIDKYAAQNKEKKALAKQA